MGSFEILEGNITERKTKNNNNNKKTIQTTCLTTITCGDGEVTRTSSFTTSEWGLGREMWAASLVLRVRTGPECPEDNLREQM